MNLRYALLSILPLFLLPACQGADKSAIDFCKGHTTAKWDKAYALLAQNVRLENTLSSYRNFTWDQQSFDLRLLQSHDQCAATIRPLNEEQAIATIDIGRHGGDAPFSCLLPLLKEDGKWLVTNKWGAANDYLVTRQRLRRELPLRYEDLATLDDDQYLAKAPVPMKDYFDQIETKSTQLKNSLGGSDLPFCFSNLNKDNGREAAFNYLIFEDKLPAIPADWANQKQRYNHFITPLSQGYKPLATTVTRGVRMDLVANELLRQKGDNGRTITQIQYRFVFWGQVHGPLAWHLEIYDKKGDMVQEGHGKEAELISDFTQYLPDAPALTMAVINMPKLPYYAKKIVLTFIEPDQMTTYQLPLPLLPEYLENGRK